MDRPRASPIAGVLLLAAFLAATLLPVLTGLDHLPRKSIDHDRNHVPVVRTFASDWPSPDLTDYDSATTPGMHLVLAAATRLLGASETLLQSLSCLFGATLVLVTWSFASRVAGGTLAALCTLPLACSPYVLGNSIWVMTDNLALATVAIPLGASLFVAPSGRAGTLSAASLIASVLVRQINVWPSAVTALVPWLSAGPLRRRLPFHDAMDRRFSPGAAIAGAAGLLGAFGVLGVFMWMWGGLVPPAFQAGGDGAAQHAGGLNLAVTGYVLTLFGTYGGVAMLLMFPLWREDHLVVRRMAAGGAIGLAVGLTFASAPGAEAGRSGGWLWTLAELAPVFGGRSMVIAMGATWGGAVAGALFGLLVRSGQGRAAWITLALATSFLAAYSANLQAFQRYFDPAVLLALGWILALLRGGRTTSGRIEDGRLGATAIAIAAMQIALSLATLYIPLWLEGRAPTGG